MYAASRRALGATVRAGCRRARWEPPCARGAAVRAGSRRTNRETLRALAVYVRAHELHCRQRIASNRTSVCLWLRAIRLFSSVLLHKLVNFLVRRNKAGT